MNYSTNEMRATLRAATIRRAFADWLRAESDRLVSAADFDRFTEGDSLHQCPGLVFEAAYVD